MGRLEAIFGAAEAVLERASEVLEAQATARAETGAAAPPSAAAAGLVPVGPASRSMAPCLVAEQPEVCLLWKPAGWAVTVGGEDRLATAADALEGEVEEAPRGKGGSSSAHLHHAGHAVVGDVLYGGQAACPPWCPRLFLHAHRLALDVGDGPLEAQVPLPEDLQAVLRSIARMSARLGGQSAEALQQWLTGQEDTQQ
uniref:Pseudouridine synthase RsuA/RluA-like domain-containing protein n=1 Tax=Alexandrium monilatum TaxID=311494 RepID=A0A7S4Q835_9DINO